MQISGYDVKVNGKYHISNGAFYPEQSGTYIEFHGHIRKIEADIFGKTFEYPAYLAIMVDEADVQFFEVKDGPDHQVLYEGDGDKDITVRIIKTTEEQYGTVAVQKLDIEGDVLPTGDCDKRFLFIGDSITCGYGIDAVNGDIFTTESENFLKAYPYLVAKRLNADYDTLCQSGDGIISRWIPEEVDAPLPAALIPDLFEREIERPEERTKSYSRIIVNLGTNDASYTKGLADRERLFSEKYGAFLKKVHEVYRDAQITVVYGILENSLSQPISDMAAGLKRTGVSAEYLDVSDNYVLDGVGGHPGAKDHKLIAERIISHFTDENLSG